MKWRLFKKFGKIRVFENKISGRFSEEIFADFFRSPRQLFTKVRLVNNKEGRGVYGCLDRDFWLLKFLSTINRVFGQLFKVFMAVWTGCLCCFFENIIKF